MLEGKWSFKKTGVKRQVVVRWSSKVVEMKGMDLLDLEKKFQKKISSGKYFFELG